MFGMMLKSTHDRLMADTVSKEAFDTVCKAYNDAKDELKEVRELNYALDRTAAKFKAERDEARTACSMRDEAIGRLTAELADLKAKRARSNANLAAANDRRRAEAQLRANGGAAAAN